MIALIGSTALSHTDGYRDRAPRDLDIVAPHDEIGPFVRRTHGRLERFYPVDKGKKLYARADGLHIEAEIAWSGSTSRELLDLIEEDGLTTEFRGETVLRASPSVCLALKLSHRFKKNSPHFLKTMRDIQMLRERGAVISDRLKPFLKRREAETYDYGHPSLKQSKADFFADDNIEYVWDHDTIHEAVKHLDKPAYNYYKPDENEVYCSKDLFFAVGERIRLLGVLEESYVLALERSQIPHPGVMTRKKSFDTALMKVASSITSGFFREYSWENYDKVQAMYSDDYVDRFNEAVKNGIVLPHRR